MSRFLSFLHRRWFRIGSAAFFFLLLVLYLGFKFVLTESFVRSRILPMGERGLRHGIGLDDVRGGFVLGFVAQGVRIKDPIDLGPGDHITIREVRVRPSWWDLFRGRIVFRSIDCEGVLVLFRKLPDGRGNWMPDPRYPQLRGKAQADPVIIRTLNVSDIEYRFEDEGTDFTTVLRVRDFAGSIRSDENAVVTVEGSWRTDELVFGRPLRRQHVPEFASEGAIVSDTRRKRTDLRIRGFRGGQEVKATGVYNWEPGNSFIDLELTEATVTFEGEFFRSMFPGFLPLVGPCEFEGNVFRGKGETRVRVDAYSAEARIDQPGFAERPFRDIRHRTEFRETKEIAQLVWTATGTMCAAPDTATCLLPFRTDLAYTPRGNRLTVRELRMESPDAVLDASGYVWFEKGRRPVLGLEAQGHVALGGPVAKAVYAGVPLEASMAFGATLGGPVNEPVLTLEGGAPWLRVSFPWAAHALEIPEFGASEKLEWNEDGRLGVSGRVMGGTGGWSAGGIGAPVVPPFHVEHRLVRPGSAAGWHVTELEATLPRSRISLRYPATVSAGPVHFRGEGETEEIAPLLAAELPAAVTGPLRFEGAWVRDATPQVIVLRAQSPGLGVVVPPSPRQWFVGGLELSVNVIPEEGGAVSVSTLVDATEVSVTTAGPHRLDLGVCALDADLAFDPGARTPGIRGLTVFVAGWVVDATPISPPPTRLWEVSAEGDLSRLLTFFPGAQSVAVNGPARLSGYVAEAEEGIEFEGIWAGDSLWLRKRESGAELELMGVAGEQWGEYQRDQGLLVHGRLEAATSVLRSGTLETPLGPTEADAGIRWLKGANRLELSEVRLRNDRMKMNLSGESALGQAQPASHHQLDATFPLELLGFAVAGGEPAGAVAPGTGDLRLRGELWREGDEGRGSFRVTADEIEIGSISAGGSLAARAGPRTVWNWDAAVEIGTVIYKEHVSTNHHHLLRREGDRLWLDESRCTIGGGELSAVAAVEFGTPEPRLSGEIWVDGSDLAAWIPSFVADATGSVGGIASATAVWSAAGTDTAALRRSLRASFTAGLRDGFFHKTTVTRGISSVLGIDELQNVTVYTADARGNVENQRLTVRKAHLFTDRYRAEIEGHLDFDGNQDFRMILNLPIPLAQQIPDLGGIEKIFPREVPIALKAGGTVRAPDISVVRYSLIERPLSVVGDMMKRLGRFFRFGGESENDSKTESPP